MSRDALLSQIKQTAFLEGEFTTRAGKKTNYYIDKYLFETNPGILKPLAKELAHLFPDPSTYDRIAAPELGAVPLAAVVSVELNKPFIIVKKQSKEYGTSKKIEGAYKKGERVIVLEDIMTTGGAVIKAAEILRNEGLHFDHVIGVINREEGAIENLKKDGFKTIDALFTSTELKNAK